MVRVCCGLLLGLLLLPLSAAAQVGPTPPQPPPGGGSGLSATAPISPVVVALWAALLLFGAAWMWRLSRGRGPGPLPRRLERLPSAGLLGEGTPPLSEGLTVWQCRPEDAAAAVGPLLARLAQRHRVLLAASERTPIPAVAGGPVYRVHGARPRELGDLAARLAEAPGLPVTVLMLGQGRDAADLRASEAALPVGIGGVVLLAEPARTALPTASLTRVEGGWRLDTDQRVLSLVERDGAFHPA